MKNIFSRTLEYGLFALLLAGAAPTFAQGGRGFDMFGNPRYFVVTGIQTITNNLANQSTGVTVSNTIAAYTSVDVRNCVGEAVVLLSVTNNNFNAAAPTMYAFLEGSMDQTNWYTLTNTAIMTNLDVSITNAYWGNTNVQTVNRYPIPGVFTTPTSATAGFASVYLQSAPLTATGILCTNVTGTQCVMGWNIADGPRYIHIVYKVGGTNASFTVSAVAIAYRESTSP